jgi:nucleoside-diphosphate-sugar epimerase
VRVVITGATGNIGTTLVGRLSERGGTEIVGVARRRPEWQPARTSWVAADVTVDDLVPVFRGADAVVHLAWAFQPTHDPRETWRVNVGGTERVLAAVAEAGVPAVVHSSSVGAYSPGPKDDPVDEDWPTDAVPTAGYGREKAYAERLLDAFELRHPHVRTVRLRPAFIFKPAASPEQHRIFAGHLVPSWPIAHRLLPLVPSLPDLRFQALHADDVAAAFELAITRDVRGAFNIAADPILGPADLARVFGGRPVPCPRRVLRAAVAVAWHLRLVPASPHLLDLFLDIPVMDTTRARTELGWTPVHSGIEALEAFRRGEREQEGMATAPLHA